MERVQNREPSPQTCPKCNGKGKIMYTQQSFFGQIQNVQTCPDCGGSGKMIKDKCPDCRGTGYIARKRKIQVTIPAGIDNGQSVRIREKGEPGVNGGPRGDLLVEVVVSRHPIFQRQDVHICIIHRNELRSYLEELVVATQEEAESFSVVVGYPSERRAER